MCFFVPLQVPLQEWNTLVGQDLSVRRRVVVEKKAEVYVWFAAKLAAEDALAKMQPQELNYQNIRTSYGVRSIQTRAT